MKSAIRSDYIGLALIVGIGAAVRLVYLSQPVRYDETVTWLAYVRLPWLDLLSNMGSPNNHILHTALARIAIDVAGDSVWAVRLPAFLAGVAGIPATYLLGRALGLDAGALLAAAIVAGNCDHILYSTNARGYTLVVVIVCCLASLMVTTRGSMTTGRAALCALLIALGLFVIPSMLFAAGALTLWMIATPPLDGSSRRTRAVQAVTIAASGCLLSLVFYLPLLVRSGPAPLFRGQERLHVDSWADLVAQTSFFWRELAYSWTFGMPAPLIWLLAAALAVAGARIRSNRAAQLLAASIVTALVLFLAARALPPSRALLFSLPFAACAAATEVERAARKLGKLGAAGALAVGGSVLVAASLAFLVWRSERVLESYQTGTLRDGAAIAEFLAPRLGRLGEVRVVSLVPSDWPLRYHFEARHLPLRALDFPDSSTTRAFVVVNSRHRQSLRIVLDSTGLRAAGFDGDRLVRNFRAASLYEVERRRR